MKSLNNHPVIIRPKTGLKANINATATKALATEGELHWTSDTAELFSFNGTENVRVPSLASAASAPWSGTFTNGATVTVENGITIGAAPSAPTISSDANNGLTTGTDGGLFVTNALDLGTFN